MPSNHYRGLTSPGIPRKLVGWLRFRKEQGKPAIEVWEGRTCRKGAYLKNVAKIVLTEIGVEVEGVL